MERQRDTHQIPKQIGGNKAELWGCAKVLHISSSKSSIHNLTAQEYPPEAYYTGIIEVRTPPSTYYNRNIQGLKPSRMAKGLKINTIKVGAI